jgi:hypothetical protein
MHCSWRINDTVALKKQAQHFFFPVAGSLGGGGIEGDGTRKDGCDPGSEHTRQAAGMRTADPHLPPPGQLAVRLAVAAA